MLTLVYFPARRCLISKARHGTDTSRSQKTSPTRYSWTRTLSRVRSLRSLVRPWLFLAELALQSRTRTRCTFEKARRSSSETPSSTTVSSLPTSVRTLARFLEMVADQLCADVMDYSLVVGVDSAKGELVVGIVGTSSTFLVLQLPRQRCIFADFIRTFTWDKRVENWVKDSAFLGGKSLPFELSHQSP